MDVVFDEELDGANESSRKGLYWLAFSDFLFRQQVGCHRKPDRLSALGRGLMALKGGADVMNACWRLV